MRGRNTLLKGIVHLSFPGGGMFLPARTPYDWQTLVEHVKDRVRSKGEVQVLIHDHRWLVRWCEASARSVCAVCGLASESTCHSSTSGSTVYCVSCAFGEPQAAA